MYFKGSVCFPNKNFPWSPHPPEGQIVFTSQAPSQRPLPVTASGLQAAVNVEEHWPQQQTSPWYSHSCNPGETQRWRGEGILAGHSELICCHWGQSLCHLLGREGYLVQPLFGRNRIWPVPLSQPTSIDLVLGPRVGADTPAPVSHFHKISKRSVTNYLINEGLIPGFCQKFPTSQPETVADNWSLWPVHRVQPQQPDQPVHRVRQGGKGRPSGSRRKKSQHRVDKSLGASTTRPTTSHNVGLKQRAHPKSQDIYPPPNVS